MNDIWTVFSAEFIRRGRSRPFFVVSLLGVFFVVLATILPSLITHGMPASVKRAVVIADGNLGARASALLRPDFSIVATLANATPSVALLREYNASTVFLLHARSGELAVTAFAKDPRSISALMIRRDLLSLQLERVTTLSAKQIANAVQMPVAIRAIDSKFASSDEEEAGHGVVLMLLVFLYLAIVLNSQLVMSSVAEEKTSRIAELLIASINPSVLLSGKILAGTALALLQMVLWLGFGLFFGSFAAHISGAAATQPSIVLSALIAGNFLAPLTICAFLAFFLIGLLQITTLLAGVGSMITRTEDIGSMALPMLLPTMIAFFMGTVAIRTPEASWAVAASFVPIISPFVMFARLGVGLVPAWQIALSICLNLVVLLAIVWASGRIYRVGMLFYGRSPSLGQIWKALRMA